jgi:hypothetical protein
MTFDLDERWLQERAVLLVAPLPSRGTRARKVARKGPSQAYFFPSIANALRLFPSDHVML